MHLRSVARPLGYMVDRMKIIKKFESEPVKVVKKVSEHKNSNGFGGQGKVFEVAYEKKAPHKILAKQLELIESSFWNDEFKTLQTDYCSSVAEMRERHRNRIAAEDPESS